MSKYGTLVDNKLHPAPRAVRIGGAVVCNPTDAQYEAAGYKRVVDERPSQPASNGYHYEAQGWAELGGVIQRVYAAIQDPAPPPRRWTRLAIKTALAQAGMLAAARQFLSETEIAQGYTAWEALTDCDYIEEGFGGTEAWAALLDGAAQALGKTRAEIDAFLDSSPPE